MALGPLGRIVAQVVVVAGSAVGRAIVRAYKDAAQRGPVSGGASGGQPLTLRPRMTPDEARKILGFEARPGDKIPSREEIMSRFHRLYQINAPAGNFAGSPYLQKKVTIARTILLDEYAKASHASNGSSTSSSAKP
ncbi:hypothetical protein ACSSS7_000472 [Eimeria intestinalis]